MSVAGPQGGEMRAILVKGGKGDLNALYIGSAPVPQLKDPNEVLVRIKAFGVNRMDILQRNGQYPLPPGAPEIMGVEFSGRVVQAGSEAKSQHSGSGLSDDFKKGDEVFGLALGGAYAEYIVVKSNLLLHKPAALSHVQAAAIPENWLTAFQALRPIANLQPGEDVLVHAGASGVGLAAQQLARDFGARNVYATAGSEEKCRFCEQTAGADKAFNYKACDWAEELAKYTCAGKTEGCADVIMDFIGASYWNSNIASLKRDGRLVIQGAMGGIKVKDGNIGPIIFKRLRIEGSTLRSRTVEYQGELVQSFLKEGGLDKIIAGVSKESGVGGNDKLRPHSLVIHKVYAWEDIQEAHREMEANKNVGKIVVTIDG
ncbi:quinone oxidoreductase putative [Tilletiaria anomala UBC 951]|uniref:Quinone oxidoreductase putative n=1 Tax=Tilletiaria anomala (strain ATCC 24038 / CBS 436.72 / UBC 951) TaxID=1037660 RepID=A0A066WEQ7_TILAU|nr:quinone oxidoreductase putative [Tilletiaria anomala UBC 951]KDN52412.1 quinone oxidoreductase putative [Tilletiaria anomala UBC 951]